MVTSPFRFDYAPLETLQRSTAVFGRLIMEPKVHRPLPQIEVKYGRFNY